MKWRKLLKPVLGIALIAGLFLGDNETQSQKNARELAFHNKQKKEAKIKLAHDYGTSLVTSEAVFILPPNEIDDDPWKAKAYALNDALNARGIPSFVVGDTSGNATTETITDNIKKIQEKHCFQSVTTISLMHGTIINVKKNHTYPDSVAESAWVKFPDNTEHLSSINRTKIAPATYDLMRDMAEAAQVSKMDWFSYSCYAGAMNQKGVNTLPEGSTFIAMCGPGQSNYFEGWNKFITDLNDKTFQLDEGVDATDLLVEALQENWRYYNADVVVAVSGGSNPAVIASDFKNNDIDTLHARTTNLHLLDRAKRLRIPFRPH